MAPQPDPVGFDPLSLDFDVLVDRAWYLADNPDVATAGIDPVDHFRHHGLAERRDPNPHFDGVWYLRRYPDVAGAGLHPLLHYFEFGAAELRDPHAGFDAGFYADLYPEAAANPLMHHLAVGASRGYRTEKRLVLADCLPSDLIAPACPDGIEVDIVIPVYRGFEQTRRCIETVLADTERPPGKVIVVDDRSPEPGLSAWLDEVHARGCIHLVRQSSNQGFVVSANRGIAEAGRADVVLLNSDTEVPPGWLGRLAGHAYAAPRIASVSPFSNNATICSYPGPAGGPMPGGLDVNAMDALCRGVNAGRSVAVPTTVGFCMYIRRACLDEIGPFDVETFGRGYGEENDFCMRAAGKGWTHRLACDVFVYHEGKVSFGADSADLKGKWELLGRRHPTYPALIARHVRSDEAGPYRFAVTAALCRGSAFPVVLLVSHGLGGGVRQHLAELIDKTGDRAAFLLLRPTPRGVELSVPGRADHPTLVLGVDRLADLVVLLRSMSVSRVHVHHLLGMEMDVRRLIAELAVPFDFTVHDYFAVCPQINLLPRRYSHYCGEIGPAFCNACIAARPQHGASNILAWRASRAWLFREAARVICPSDDARQRLRRYGMDERGLVVPHEPVASAAWPMRQQHIGGGRLRVAVLGVLSEHKGAQAVAAALEAADPKRFEFWLIGHALPKLREPAASRLRETGEYLADELPALIDEVQPHLIWFPSQWPETYNYTLTAAIDSGLPILANRIGAYPERLDGRPSTWFIRAESSSAELIRTLEDIRERLEAGRMPSRPKRRPAVPDYYRTAYLPQRRGPAASRRHVDLRRDGRTSVAVLPDRLADGSLSPCAYIRVLQPLDHPAIARNLDVSLLEPIDVPEYRADILVASRHAVPDLQAAERVVRHCRAVGMRLVYDLDDDLVTVPKSHPEAAALRPRSLVVKYLVRQADQVWASTLPLAKALSPLSKDVRVVPNGLDERIWLAGGGSARMPFSPVRILYMGTATHDADLDMLLPALARLSDVYGEQVRVDVVGVTAGGLPPWVNRVTVPAQAGASYPAFVNWIVGENRWDVGVAPLVKTKFNQCKSAIKAMDYAALGLAILASDIEPYRGSIADGPAGMLVGDGPASWFEALSRLVDDERLLGRLRDGARANFGAHTLAAQGESRRLNLLQPVKGAQVVALRKREEGGSGRGSMLP